MPHRRKFRLRAPSGAIILGERTLIMAVLNVTPDSFSDGNQFLDPQSATEHGLAMQHAGADLLDIGGESTRPGSPTLPAPPRAPVAANRPPPPPPPSPPKPSSSAFFLSWKASAASSPFRFRST